MEHLHRLTLVLDPAQQLSLNPARANSLAPYLQGFLMQKIDSEYATYLHGLPFNPYGSRCQLRSDHRLTWDICALTDQAYQKVIRPLEELETIHLKAPGADLRVVQSDLSSMETKQLTDLISSDGPDRIHVRFATPTAFRSKGEYVFIPSVRLIFQSLLMHYFYVYEGRKEVDEETLEYIDSHVRLSSFNIHSQYFDHAMGKGKKVPAFVGTVGLSMKGPQQVKGLCRMLLSFGEYAGVGIKTSMGMGGIECL